MSRRVISTIMIHAKANKIVFVNLFMFYKAMSKETSRTRNQ